MKRTWESVVYFFKSSPEDMFIDFREKGRRRGREKHRSVVSCTRPAWEPNQGLMLQRFDVRENAPTS